MSKVIIQELIKKILEAFEKKFSLKKSTKSTFGRGSKFDLETFFQKVVDFLQYNLIGVSYDSNFFTDVIC